MSREMKSEEINEFEKKYGYKPTQIRVAIDALAVYVNKDKPLEQPHAAAAQPSRTQTKAATAAEHRRMTSANCNAINERAQLGEMTDDDREMLKNCRGGTRP